MSIQEKIASSQGASFLDIVRLAVDQKKSVDNRKELSLALMNLTQKRLEHANQEWQKEIDKLETEQLHKEEKSSKSANTFSILITVFIVLAAISLAVMFPPAAPFIAAALIAGFASGELSQNVQGDTMFFKESFWVNIDEGKEKLDDVLFRRILAEANKKHTVVQTLQNKTQQHVQLELTPLESKKQSAANLIQGSLNAFRDIAESTNRR